MTARSNRKKRAAERSYFNDDSRKEEEEEKDSIKSYDPFGPWTTQGHATTAVTEEVSATTKEASTTRRFYFKVNNPSPEYKSTYRHETSTTLTTTVTTTSTTTSASSSSSTTTTSTVKVRGTKAIGVAILPRQPLRTIQWFGFENPLAREIIPGDRNDEDRGKVQRIVNTNRFEGTNQEMELWKRKGTLVLLRTNFPASLELIHSAKTD